MFINYLILADARCPLPNTGRHSVMRIETSDVTHAQQVASAFTSQDDDHQNTNSTLTDTSHESIGYDLYPGVMVRYQCQPHYEPINAGVTSRTCQVDGTWSGQPLDCEGMVDGIVLLSYLFEKIH